MELISEGTDWIIANKEWLLFGVDCLTSAPMEQLSLIA
jgi:hypothetical protein